MRIFVPFSEELFETAGRQARSLGEMRSTADANGVPDGVPDAGPDGRQAGTADARAEDENALGELVPFRLDYRCLRLKARPREHAAGA